MSTEPIIRPLWIYLLDVVNGLELAFVIIAVLVGLGLCFGAMMMGFSLSKDDYDDDYKFGKKVIKITLPIVLVCLLLIAAIPSQKTVYTMVIADQVTPANIQYVGNTVEDCVDYMFDKVDDLINEGDADE